jgi:hypothetical protein
MVRTRNGNHPSRSAYQKIGAMFVLGLMAVIGPPLPLRAQDSDVAREHADPLTTDQQQVAGRYKKLEELLLRSAELESAENPARSALLQQAAQLGKQSQLADLLARAATRLDKKQYSQALEDQRTSRENLKRLLELLQSENRGERVREQRDQVRRWIEETDRLLRLQKSLSGRTEGGQEMKQAAGDQNKLANKAQEIAKDLGGDDKEAKDEKLPTDSKSDGDSKSKDEASSPEKPPKDETEKAAGGEGSEATESGDKPQDGNKTGESQDGKSKSESKNGKPEDGKPEDDKPEDGKPEDGKPEDGKPEDGKPEDGKPEDGKPDEKKSSDAEKQDAEQKSENGKTPDSPAKESDPSKSGESQKSPEGQSQPPGESQQGQSGEQPKQQEPKDPTERAKKRIEQAQRKMEEAQKALEDAERKGAVEKQREAESELRSAIEALEEILRQLREEEIERSLASLETRLRRMLEMQNKVLEETLRLQEITGDQASRQIEIRAGSLAGQERKILEEGRRAFLLLREEGSSAAFPEAMEQVNTDIGNVAERLAKADIGKLTITVEQEIVSSLEEMVTALVQVQKDQKEKKQKQQQGQQPQGEPGEQPLVDKLAELRLIRTLQMRINNRTTSLSQMLADPADVVGQAKEADILKEVKGLADRQSSIQQVTREIVVGADK